MPQQATRVVVDPELLRVHRSRKARKTHHGATAGGSSSSSGYANEHPLPSDAPFCVKFQFKPKQLQRNWEASLHRPAALGDASTMTSKNDWTLEVDAPGPVWKSANQNGTHAAGSEESTAGAAPLLAQAKDKQGSTFSGPQHAAKEYECLLLWDPEQKAYMLRPQLSTFNLKLEQGKNTISDVGKAVLARQPVGLPSNAKQRGKRPAAGADRNASPAPSQSLRLTGGKSAVPSASSPGRAAPYLFGGSPKQETAMPTKMVIVKRTTVSSGQSEGASPPASRPVFRMKKAPTSSSPNKKSPPPAPARSLSSQATPTMTSSSSSASIPAQADSTRLSPPPVADQLSPGSPLSEPTSSSASPQKEVAPRASLMSPPASLPVQTLQSNKKDAQQGAEARIEMEQAFGRADADVDDDDDDAFEGELEAMLDAKLDEPPTPLDKPRGDPSWPVPTGLAASAANTPSSPQSSGVRHDPKTFSPPMTRRKSQLGTLLGNPPAQAINHGSSNPSQGGGRVSRSGVTAIQSIGGASHRRVEEEGLSDSD